MTRVGTWVAIAGLLLVLTAANKTIIDRQAIVDHGRPLLLQLRPVDPRSLMQGDYMILRYMDQLFPPENLLDTLPRKGAFIVAVDENNVARFSRLDDGGDLRPEEARLRYKLLDRHGRIRLGAESFFFQEGHAHFYNGATFGVLHVGDDGTSVLVGLANRDLALIEPE